MARLFADVRGPMTNVTEAAVHGVLTLLLLALALLTTAGRIDWDSAWILMCASAVGMIGLGTLLQARDPELLVERLRGFKQTQPWDRRLAPTAVVVLPVILFAIAGLDERYGWSPALPMNFKLLALIPMALGYSLVLWAMDSNTFFSAAIRVQRERGHKVVSKGPYAFMRHPGYAGMMTVLLSLPILLGSFWALIPALMSALLFCLRAVLEEDMLRSELEGYRYYMRCVPNRFIPNLR